MDKKLGVYICEGCGIGACLSAEKLVQVASQEYQAPIVRRSSAFCLEDAQLIREDVEKGEVNAAVVAACSGRVNTEIFSFQPAIVERVSLREQVAWTQTSGHEETQSLADDYLRMGIIRAQMTQFPSLIRRQTSAPCWWSVEALQEWRRLVVRPGPAMRQCW